MPQIRSCNRRRSCRDLSISNDEQKTINFPTRKTSTTTNKSVVNSAAKKDEQKNSMRKFPEKQDSTNKRTGKRRTKINDENSENCSPIKSPRKEDFVHRHCQSPLADRTNQCNLKSPLADRTNQCSKLALVNHSNSSLNNTTATCTDVQDVEVVKQARRKLSLVDSQADSGYTQLCQVLHNSIPTRLISREKELQQLKDFVELCVVNLNPGSLYMCGAPGTGKTACLTKVLEECKGLKVRIVFLNCMSLRQSQSIFSRLANLLDNTGKTYSNQEGTKYLEKKLTRAGQRILLVLDEIDQLESKDQQVLYKLFEMPFLPNSKLVLVGIANSLDFTDRILPRLQTKESCKPIMLRFQPYKKDEICSILQERIKDTNNIVDQSAIQFCARKVSAMSGDARKALDILRRAVEIAEGQSRKATLQEKVPEVVKVTIAHVASVCSDVYGARLSNKTKVVFPLQQEVIICTVVACLKDVKVKEIMVCKLYESYCKVSNSRHLSPVGQEEFNGICSLLESQGIFLIKKAKDLRNGKICLCMQENEIEHALQDKTLMTSILSDGIPR